MDTYLHIPGDVYTLWVKKVPVSEPLEGIFIIDSYGIAEDRYNRVDPNYLVEFVEALYRVFGLVVMVIVWPNLCAESLSTALYTAKKCISDRTIDLYGPDTSKGRVIEQNVFLRVVPKACWLVIVAMTNDPIRRKYYPALKGASHGISTESIKAAVIINEQVQWALGHIAKKVLVVYGGAAENHGYKSSRAKKYDAHVAAVVGHLRRLGCFVIPGRRHAVTLALYHCPGAIHQSAIGPAMANLAYWAYLVSNLSHRAYYLGFLRLSRL